MFINPKGKLSYLSTEHVWHGSAGGHLGPAPEREDFVFNLLTPTQSLGNSEILQEMQKGSKNLYQSLKNK